jgi:acyl transferase domain-containing protein
MKFFAAPHRIALHGGAGSCRRRDLSSDAVDEGIWSDLLSEARASANDAAAEIDAVEWVVVEHYLRELLPAPRATPELAAVLVSFDDGVGESAIRLYTRVVRHDGAPLACGFTTLLCSARDTGRPTPIPTALTRFLHTREGFREAIGWSDYVQCVLSGRDVEPLFPPEVCDLGARVASQTDSVLSDAVQQVASLRPTTAVAARRSGSFALPVPGFAELALPVGGAAFTFPGDRSYDGRLLRELHAYLPYLSDHFHEADNVARRFFRHAFLPLVEVDTLALHDQRLERCPELAHLGVGLCGVLIAETLQEHDVRPEVLIGEGLGQVTALAVAGAIDVGTALRLAAQRAASRRRMDDAGPGEDDGSVPAGDITVAVPKIPVLVTVERL